MSCTEQMATLKAIFDRQLKYDKPPYAWEIGAEPGRHWPANRDRAEAFKVLLEMGLVKRADSGRCWLTNKGRLSLNGYLQKREKK